VSEAKPVGLHSTF